MRDPRTSKRHLTATVATLKGPCPRCKGESCIVRVVDGWVSMHEGGQRTVHAYEDLYLYVRAVKASGFGWMLKQFLRQLPGATCSACGDAIVFVYTRRGKLMPLNVDGEQIGDSHFATCPNAKAFRRGTVKQIDREGV